MRRRLIAALLGIAVATLVLYGGPRTFMIADLVRDQERDKLDRTAWLVAEAIDIRIENDLPVDEEVVTDLLAEDVQVDISLADDTEISVGQVGQTELATTVRLTDGGRLTVRLARSAIDERISDALLSVVLIGAGSVVGALLLAAGLARALTSPFDRLITHAEGLGDGAETSAPRSGVSEADRLADALDRGRARVQELLRREREFSANASHQLRTPLAALRLRIEDLTHWDVNDEVRAELDAALAEIDRLADTVTDLLELARAGGIGGWRDVDLSEAVRERVERWTETLETHGRRVTMVGVDQPVLVASADRAVHLVLDVLLENALVHGSGVIDVRVQAFEDRASVFVADEGTLDRNVGSTAAFARDQRSASSPGNGIGLSLARTIAESAGGRLHVASQDPTVFELVFPRAVEDG